MLDIFSGLFGLPFRNVLKSFFISSAERVAANPLFVRRQCSSSLILSIEQQISHFENRFVLGVITSGKCFFQAKRSVLKEGTVSEADRPANIANDRI